MFTASLADRGVLTASRTEQCCTRLKVANLDMAAKKQVLASNVESNVGRSVRSLVAILNELPCLVTVEVGA